VFRLFRLADKPLVPFCFPQVCPGKRAAANVNSPRAVESPTGSQRCELDTWKHTGCFTTLIPILHAILRNGSDAVN